MFNIQLAVHSIDYETTFETIFPLLLEKCRQHDSHFLFRLMTELDQDAQPVLLGLIQHISASTRDELLCQCMEVYGPTLISTLNQYLRADNVGRNFSVGGVCIIQQNGGLRVIAEDVRVDFKGLLESQQVKDKVGSAVDKYVGKGLLGKLAGKAVEGALKAVTELSPEDIEKSGAALLKNSTVQNKLLEIADEALNSKGIAISFSDIEILPDIDSGSSCYQGPLLTPELETAVIHAIGEYLRRTVSITESF